jgi:hypothetical protein
MIYPGPIETVSFAPSGKYVHIRSSESPGQFIALPPPIGGRVERVTLWVQTVTGLALADRMVQVLDDGTWQVRAQELRKAGGPPVP